MKVGTRIFFSCLFIFSTCLYYPCNWIVETLRTRYLEGVEDPLVDQANILATLVAQEMQQDTFDPEQWYAAFTDIYALDPLARIYRLEKQQVDQRIYITDAAGIVIFDSRSRTTVGQDFSSWRDVHLTLQGKYGARTSKTGSKDTSSVLYVAAPILIDSAIAGVLTVAKPTTNITYFVHNAKLTFTGVAVVALIAAGLLSYLASWWITLPIKRLTSYAQRIRDNQPAVFPKLDSSEIGAMGKAFGEMQDALEGKHYVEQYVQHLTHEIKSPLSAIRGAAELLTEPMPSRQQGLFLANIKNESLRIQRIVDRMLALSALESRKSLLNKEEVGVPELLQQVLAGKQPQIVRKELQVLCQAPAGLKAFGDAFLLHQAMSNLVQNAIDFSPAQGLVTIRGVAATSGVRLEVIDQGPGIPDFAGTRIFEKFFSLKRPDSHRKSTGLGLNFVQQIALIHRGTIRVENLEGTGTRAVLRFPGPGY